jgi:hypothetical protein
VAKLKRGPGNLAMNQNSVERDGTEHSGYEIFEVWRAYEDIAMHFNDLLIKLRVQALAGVAAISALVGFLSKGDTPEDFRWGIVAGMFLILTLFWIAIWFLDFRYYNRLLFGAVAGIIEIEKRSEKSTTISQLRLSHLIEQAVVGDVHSLSRAGWLSGRHWFYILVLFALLLGLYASTSELCLVGSEKSIVHSHGVCRVILHSGTGG